MAQSTNKIETVASFSDLDPDSRFSLANLIALKKNLAIAIANESKDLFRLIRKWFVVLFTRMYF